MATHFVEGTTIDIGFDGRSASFPQLRSGHPEVFAPNAPGEWIHPEAASAEAIVQVAETCPSGAITYRRKDGGPSRGAAGGQSSSRLRENGPLAIRAEMEIDGETLLRATLCRCGASQNKPFCDSSHTSRLRRDRRAGDEGVRATRGRATVR